MSSPPSRAAEEANSSPAHPKRGHRLPEPRFAVLGPKSTPDRAVSVTAWPATPADLRLRPAEHKTYGEYTTTLRGETNEATQKSPPAQGRLHTALYRRARRRADSARQGSGVRTAHPDSSTPLSAAGCAWRKLLRNMWAEWSILWSATGANVPARKSARRASLTRRTGADHMTQRREAGVSRVLRSRISAFQAPLSSCVARRARPWCLLRHHVSGSAPPGRGAKRCAGPDARTFPRPRAA